MLDGELAQSVALLAPVLVVRTPFRLRDDDDSDEDGDGAAAEPRMSSLASLDLTVVDQYGVMEIIGALDALDDHATRILELASERLRA